MEFSSFHKPYSHKTRFKVVHSKTRIVKLPKTKTTLSLPSQSVSQFKFVRNGIKQGQVVSPSKPALNRVRSIDKSSVTIAKSIESKYKWMRTSLKTLNNNSFKLDHRKISTPSLINSRVTKHKPRASLSKCLIRIRGVKFHTHPNGKCLQRLTSDSDSSKILASIPVKKLEHPTIARANSLLQRSIQISNGRFRLRNAKKKSGTSLKKKKNCIYFNRFGKCHRGDKCPFIHDRTRIAVCTQFLNGRCKNTSCPYLHELTPGKVPTCSYFIKGACGQDNCPYAHSYVGHDAQICEDFVQGFCARGIECSKQHVLLCRDFESTGQCSRGKQCHLTHRRKRNEHNSLKNKSSSSKTDDTSMLLSGVMPAYIPLKQENQKKSTQVEFKLKPSFLS